MSRAVNVAQLAGRLLPIPEICGSNQIKQILKRTYLLLTVEKTKINEKGAGNGPLLKNGISRLNRRWGPYSKWARSIANGSGPFEQCDQKKSPNVYISCPKMISLEK